MKAVDLLVTTLAGQDVAGTILWDEDEAAFTIVVRSGYDTLMKEVMDGLPNDVDPVEWLEGLHREYSGSYLRATEPYHTEDGEKAL